MAVSLTDLTISDVSGMIAVGIVVGKLLTSQQRQSVAKP